MAQLNLYSQQGWPYTDRQPDTSRSAALEHGRTQDAMVEGRKPPVQPPANWKSEYGSWSEPDE